jgi:hypothetical protein
MPINNPPSLRSCGMSNAPCIVHAPRLGTASEAELNVVAACYCFILFESSASKKVVVEPTPSPHAAARVKHKEEVSDVGQQTP